MKTEEISDSTNKLINFIKITHIIFLAVAPAACLLVALLPLINFNYVYAKKDPMLFIGEITFVIFSILFLILGLSLPRIIKRSRTTHSIFRELLFSHLASISLYLCIAIFSVVLGIMGSGWPFIAPLFIMAEAVLIFTFPTKKKLDKWQEKSNY